MTSPIDGPVSRRALLTSAIAGAAGLAACRAQRVGDTVVRTAGLASASDPASPAVAAAPAPAPTPTSATRAPAAFVGHGSPMKALDPEAGGEWTRWAAGFAKPKAILVVSAHWEENPTMIGATTPVPLVYDFYGFPDELYKVPYACPGAPALATEVERMLKGVVRVDRDPERGLDHGSWVPLRWMYPQADVPVLPISMPTDVPSTLLSMGRALAPLRDQGVLILGSGNVTHNLGRVGGGATPAWASEFDAWCADALARRDVDTLLDWRKKAPAPRMAHPTPDHWDPIYVMLGAALDAGSAVRFPLTGFEGGSISRRCVQIG